MPALHQTSSLSPSNTERKKVGKQTASIPKGFPFTSEELQFTIPVVQREFRVLTLSANRWAFCFPTFHRGLTPALSAFDNFCKLQILATLKIKEGTSVLGAELTESVAVSSL